MNAAQQLQADRNAAELANHRERLVWLNAPNPKWSCGTSVDAHIKNAMLLQSKAAVDFASKVSA